MSTYWMFAASDRLSEAFHEPREKLEDETEAPIKVPDDLKAKVESNRRAVDVQRRKKAQRDGSHEPQMYQHDLHLGRMIMSRASRATQHTVERAVAELKTNKKLPPAVGC
jgi:hypothetical protein